MKEYKFYDKISEGSNVIGEMTLFSIKEEIDYLDLETGYYYVVPIMTKHIDTVNDFPKSNIERIGWYNRETGDWQIIGWKNSWGSINLLKVSRDIQANDIFYQTKSNLFDMKYKSYKEYIFNQGEFFVDCYRKLHDIEYGIIDENDFLEDNKELIKVLFFAEKLDVELYILDEHKDEINELIKNFR